MIKGCIQSRSAISAAAPDNHIERDRTRSRVNCQNVSGEKTLTSPSPDYLGHTLLLSDPYGLVTVHTTACKRASS